MCAIIRDLENDLIKLNCKLKISRFVPEGLKEIIEKNVPDDQYILGVNYKHGDSQICISGHIKRGETITGGCVREMSEEVFLKPKGEIFPIKQIGRNYFYALNINDLFLSSSEDKKENEDTHKRAVVCIYGEEYNFFRYMKRLRIQNYVNDFINGLWICEKSIILKAMNDLEKKEGPVFIG